jgi:tetratricopeptide (TPR) repeat protein
LRPNYVRTIVNLGLAYNRLNDLKQAANCFLNALILNPNVSHVWTYLRTAVIKMNRMDLLEKMEARDPYMFKDEFKLIDPKNLP